MTDSPLRNRHSADHSNDNEHPAAAETPHPAEERDEDAVQSPTRRKLLKAMGAAGVALAAGDLLANWLASEASAASPASAVASSVYGSGAVPDALSGSDPGYVNVLDYGAVGDGATDDTAAFQAAAAEGKPIIVPRTASYYKLSGSVALTDSIIGVGVPDIRMEGSDGSIAKRMFLIQSYSGGGLHVAGLRLNGGYAGGSLNEQSHLVYIVHSSNVYIRSNVIEAPYGDCVYIGSNYAGPCENIHVCDNVLNNPRRCAVAVVSGRKVWISRNVINDHFPYVATIDLEPNESSSGTDLVEDIWIEANAFYSEIYFVNSYNPNAGFVNQRISITGNKGQSRYFFRCNAASGETRHVAIRDNEFFGSVSDARMIQCSMVTMGLEISGNRDYATGASGWSISSSAAPFVKDNYIDSARAIAVTFTGCQAVKFTGNQIRKVNSSYGAVRFDGTVATGFHHLAGNQLTGIGNVGYWFGAVVTDSLFDGNVTEAAGKCIQMDAAAAGSHIRITVNNIFGGSGASVANPSYIAEWTSPELQAKGALVGWASAMPTGGTWTRGTVLWNSLPSASAPSGWVCVAGGTPGTWGVLSSIV